MALDRGRERGRLPPTQKMNADEKIVLDAVLENMIERDVFRAELGNGHEFTAFVPREGADGGIGAFSVGECVRVEMSPFDFSRGKITGISNTAR